MSKYIFHFIFLLLLSITASAHTTLSSSEPKTNEKLMEPPKVLKLNFNNSVHLLKLSLNNLQNPKANIQFKTNRKANSSYKIKIPILEPGNYLISWIAMSKDTHKIKGEIPFTILPLKKHK